MLVSHISVGVDESFGQNQILEFVKFSLNPGVEFRLWNFCQDEQGEHVVRLSPSRSRWQFSY